MRPSKTQSDRPLTSADFVWDEQELEAAFTSKTKAILINTPNNPLGKVYTRQEIEKIAELCIKHNVICLADEVYEHLAVDREHIRIGKIIFTFNEQILFKYVYFVKLVLNYSIFIII